MRRACKRSLARSLAPVLGAGEGGARAEGTHTMGVVSSESQAERGVADGTGWRGAAGVHRGVGRCGRGAQGEGWDRP